VRINSAFTSFVNPVLCIDVARCLWADRHAPHLAMKNKRKHHRYSAIKGIIRDARKVEGHFASQLERDSLQVWRMTPGCASATPQYPTIRYGDIDGTPRSYRADIAVTWKCDAPRVVVECKYQHEIDSDPQLRARLQFLTELFSQNGDYFVVHTDKHIYDERFESLQHIFGYSNNDFDPIENDIVSYVAERGEVCLGALLSNVGAPGLDKSYTVPHVWRAVAHRRIFVDPRQVANEAMVLMARPLGVRVTNPRTPEDVARALDEYNACNGRAS
jgi:hypothetical protein